jgi:myo-inositol-1(or 4)-monophosphatase
MTSPRLLALISAARAGAGVLQRYFGRPEALSVAEKGPSDFVSLADLESEHVIIGELERAFPGSVIQAEESSVEYASVEPRFIVDPLDGTSNFVRGIPHFAVTLAYADERGVAAGVVLDVTRDELFWAERGKGAYLGERRLRVSGNFGLEQAIVHTGIPHRGGEQHERYLRQLASVMREVAGIRRLGSAALDLAYVASDRGDAFFERGLKPWDLAAGTLLVSEAGGKVTDQDGGANALAHGDVLAGSPEVHARLLALLRT